MDKKETLLMAVVFVAIFALAFTFAAWWNSQNVYVAGFKIISNKPVSQALRDVFSKENSLILRQELTQERSETNTAVAAVSAELVFAAKATGMLIYNYATVNGIPVNSTCNANNSFCGMPDIVVQVDNSSSPCNCIVLNGAMEIKGSPQFLLESSPNIRALVYGARAG